MLVDSRTVPQTERNVTQEDTAYLSLACYAVNKKLQQSVLALTFIGCDIHATCIHLPSPSHIERIAHLANPLKTTERATDDAR